MKLTSKPKRTGFLCRFVIAAFLATYSHDALAQGHVSASASANVSASIIQGIQITKNSNLRFGALIPGGSGGTVTVDTSGNRTSVGGFTLLSSSSFPYMAATFTLLGTPNLTYTITLPTTVTLTRQGGSETLIVGSFVSSPSTTGALDSGGNGTLAVGGTLTVPGSQTAGYYTGQFTVTLTYQ